MPSSPKAMSWAVEKQWAVDKAKEDQRATKEAREVLAQAKTTIITTA